MAGTLYLCATPIGNLQDMTPRVVETLKDVDLIAAEDTRNSIKLLNHFEISTPMTSYHEYNKVEKAYTLIEKIQNGMDIALITDAGTPAISDPGEVLVRMCHEAGVTVTSLPGPAALITALTLSGLPTRRFCFEAFLPSDKKERKQILSELSNESRTIILYEAPHHLKATLQELYQVLGERKITLCRELTKKFETVLNTGIAFDHAAIIATALYEMRSKAENYEITFKFLPRKFTLADLQRVQETLMGISLLTRGRMTFLPTISL